MKKNFKLAFVVLAAICFGQQAKAQATATANLSIQLADVMSLTLQDDQVSFVYNNATDYANTNMAVDKLSHLTVVSTKNFDITVKASQLTSGGTTLPATALAAVKVSVANSTTPNGTIATVPLAVTDGLLIDAASATATSTYDIKYAIPNATPLLKTSGNTDSAPGTYTSTVTYTIAAN